MISDKYRDPNAAERTARREEYLNDRVLSFVGSPDEPNTCIRIFEKSGLHFRHVEIDSGKGGAPVELVQITDIHFNLCDEEDEKDPELALTKKHRKWLADGASAVSAKRAMDFAVLFDKVIITGDTLDYLSHGSMELMEKYVWNAAPNVAAVLGGHELTRQMQTGQPDQTPLDERLAVLETAWRNDIHYHSETVGGKVLIILLDNSRSRYLDCQTERLAKDLAMAREQALPVLIFEHEPISTGDPADAMLRSFKRYDPEFENLYDGGAVGSVSRSPDEATRRVYDLITGNADIIKGIFCGHSHSAFYSEVRGSYIDGEGVRRERLIPQHILEGNPYDNHSGHVMRITVR